MPRMHHSFIQFQYNATKAKAKWQARVVTKKAIQQLNAEPKVVISSVSRALTSKSDRNVKQLSHVANNCTNQDTNVYHNKDANNIKYGETTINDIESELDKMFCLDNDHSTIKESSKADRTIKSNKPRSKSRKVHKQDLNELLIQLFGSNLEDIIVEKPPPVEKYQPKKIEKSRRHTLPVSINIPHDFLKPLKVSQKRKSADVISPDPKTQRRQESVATISELPHREFLITELLIKNETITERVSSTVVISDLKAAIIMERPTTGISETVQCGLVIDLTGEDSDRYELVMSSSREEVKDEPSASSERAMVPEQAPSMPLLSPVSPAQPTQCEATMPETSNSGTREPVQKGQSSSWQRPPQSTYARIAPRPPVSPQRPPTKRPHQEFQAPPNPLLSVRLPPKRCNGDSVTQALAENRNQSVPPSVIAASQLSIRPPTKHTNQVTGAQRSQQVPLQVSSVRPQIAEQVPAQVPSVRPQIAEQVPPQASSVRPQVAEQLPAQVSCVRPQVVEQVPPQASSVRSQVAERNQQASAIPVGTTPQISHSIFSNLRMLQADKTSQQAPNLRQSTEKSASTLTIPQSSSRIAMQQSPSNPQTTQQPQSNVELLQATVSSILHTAQHQAAVPQPPQQRVYAPRLFAQLPQYQGIQRQNSAPSQLQSNQAPPLIRILRPTHSQYEFHLISNAACAEKLLPHVLTMSRWKQSALRFCEEVHTYLAPNDFKQDYASFCLYTNHTLINFGKKVIGELSTVDVDNFDLREVCAVITSRLQEQNCTSSIYRVFVNIHSMIKSCEELCVTPFTKKFFHNVQMCMAKMEQKSQQVLFTVSQLKQLEWQIQRFQYFQKWLDCVYSSSSNRPSQARPPHRSATKKTQKKAAEANALKQSLQNTMLRTMLQHQNVPDRSGRSDNSARPDTTPLISDKQTVPSERPPALDSQERSQTHEAPFRVLLPQHPTVLTETASQETSVIVFTPADENRTEVPPPAAKTENEAEDIIDLTWIDDGDESVMLEEITESKAFPCKLENYPDSDTGAAREVVSPADSGLGSPHSQTDDGYRCLCGKQAIFICACGCSMYCGKECQNNDWGDHQRWCQEKST